MAYTSLVVPHLTPELIQAGESFVKALDAASVPLIAAFWLLADDETGWRLVVASPEVAQKGPLQFYSELGDRLQALKNPELNIMHVTAASPDHPTVSLLRRALGTVPGISRIRFTRNAVNGVLIPDALVYRLP